jgi:hypothetical protein
MKLEDNYEKYEGKSTRNLREKNREFLLGNIKYENFLQKIRLLT